MNKSRFSFLLPARNWGAFEIAAVYLILGSVWILFSDRVAASIALNEEMLEVISIYKGWGYVLVTALLLYWLIRRHTAALSASEQQLQQVIDAMPVFISYVGTDLRYQFTNKTYQEWYNEKAEGKHIEEVIGKAAYKTVSKYVDKVLNGEIVSYETEIPYQRRELFMAVKYIPDLAPNRQVKGFFVMAEDRTAQRQAEEEQRLWADAFEGCAHGIAIGDPNTNRVVVCNPAFASLHKCRVEDVVGSAILSLYAPSDHELVRRSIEKADQIGHVRFEAEMIRRDASTFPVQMDVVSVLGENGELLHRVVTAQDISERRLMDEKLKESEAKYRTLIEHLPAITYISGPDQYVGVSYVSPQVESLGFNAETWQAEPDLWLRQMHPDDKERVLFELQQFQAGAEAFKSEYRLITAGGETRWFRDESIRVKDSDGNTILKQGFMLDITERKRVEEKLFDQSRWLDRVNDAVLSANKDFVITAWNPAAERIYGWKAEEVIGKRGEEFLGTEFSSKTRAEVIQQLKETGEFSAEIIQARKDGTRVSIETRSVAQHDEKGEIVGYMSINRDITERKRAEEYLRRFELLSEHSRDIILFMNREDGRILEANAAALQAYGYSRDELLALAVMDLRSPETQGLTAEQMKQADTQGILFETTHQRKDGTAFPVEVSSQGATIAGVRMLISIVRDITQRKQAENALHHSQEQLLSLIKQAPISIAMFDREMRYIVASERWVAEYGRGHRDLVGRSHYEIHPDLPEQWKVAHQKGLAGESLGNENDKWVWADGTNHWLRWAIVPWHDSQGEISGIIISAEDITEGRRAEEALRLKDELLRLTSEMAKVGGWEFDPETGKGTWTDEVAKIHDLDPAQDTNVEIGLSFYVGDSRGKIEQAVKNAIELGKPYDLELQMVSAQGNHKWVRTIGLPIVHDGKVVRVQGIFQDITERKQIEKALQEAHDELELKVQARTAALSEANALLQAMMDTMPDQIYFKDRQSRFIRNSRTQASLLGLSDPAEAVGKTDFDFFPHAARSYTEEQEVMRSGTPIVDLEEWVVWPDGRETWVLTTKVPLRNSEGETIGIFGISHDITERKRAEQAIRQLNTDLEKQAEQLKAANKELEAFSYSVSHDLRAPLRAIDGYTRILVEDYESALDAEGKRICGVIGREARRMGQLIDDLLAFSRLGRKEMYNSKIDMKAMAVSVLNELLKEEDRERITVQIAELPAVLADSSLLRQVWVNLLSNALKFTSKKAQTLIEIGSETGKDEFIYYVRDSGAGFDMEYANKLFGVFQRLHTESEFEGTGVGLANVQRIILRHGGRVWAEGEVDKGATFYFALPRKENLS